MKRAIYVLVLVVSVTVAFVAGSLTSRVGAAPSAAAAPRIRHYACPMHPAQVSAQPGTAPCCGMAYAPVYEEAPSAAEPSAAADRAVRVPAQVQQAIGVQVHEVRAVGGQHALRLFGRVAADEQRTYALNAGIDGTIRELSTATTGSRVRKGQLLGTYTAPELLMAVQQYIVALDAIERRNRGELAGSTDDEADGTLPIVTSGPAGVVINSSLSNLQQRIDRLRLLGMSAWQLEEIRKTKGVPPAVKIHAPVDGIVLSRTATEGRTFARGEEWFRIADLRNVWVFADVFGDQAERVRAGLPARVRFGDGRWLEARVSDVPPQYDPATRTRTVRLDVENRGDALRPGMTVDVELAASFEPAPAVPADAIIDNGLSRMVFVEREPGTYEPRAVETGWRHDGQVQIVRGLEAGDRVVRSGSFLLDAESRMRRAARP